MKPIAIGECDACPATEVDLFEVPGSKMRLCLKDYQAEIQAIEDSKVINKVIQTSLKQDASIQRKADIHNAATLSFGELYAAIQHDDAIAPEKKTATLMQLVETRITGFTSVIFDLKAQQTNVENEREGWRQSTVDFISKLRADEREKYSKFNVSYAPTPVTKKSVKAAAGATGKGSKPRKSTGFTAAEMVQLKEAAAKYNVPMASVQMLVKSQNLSFEAAAKQMADILKLAPVTK
jgi:hypothetical protein